MLNVRDVLERFHIVDNKTTQRNMIDPEDEALGAREQKLGMVATIGRTIDYELGLKPLLEERLEELEALMAFSIDSHAKLADAHGRLNEVRSFLALFEESEGE